MDIEDKLYEIRDFMFEQKVNDFKHALKQVFDHFRKDIARIEQDQRVIDIIKTKRNDTKNQSTPD